jgi:hypothetical protein
MFHLLWIFMSFGVPNWLCHSRDVEIHPRFCRKLRKNGQQPALSNHALASRMTICRYNNIGIHHVGSTVEDASSMFF